MLRYLVCVLLALTVVVPLHGEQDVEQSAIVGLARAYVERFIDALSKVVAEERYSQHGEWPRRKRTLRSDFIVARAPARGAGTRSARCLKWTGSRCRRREQAGSPG